MSIITSLLEEYRHECDSTRRLLEKVPFDNPSWKPHEKSMSLQNLAVHIADIPNWAVAIVDHEELDFAKGDYVPKTAANTAELLAIHDAAVAGALECLARTKEEKLAENWTMRNGEQIYFTMPKGVCVRTWVFNHLYHHRGQLTVYLRLLNVPVPGMYGPTADDAGI